MTMLYLDKMFDDISQETLNQLADASVKLLPYRFNQVYGIPRSGTRFALAISKHCYGCCNNMLIVDTVYNRSAYRETLTGFNKVYDFTFGLFLYSPCETPDNVFAIFQHPEWISNLII